MKSFTVHFHQEDRVDQMNVMKLSEAEFDDQAAGGTRQLFELDTNLGFFVFVDAENHEGKESYYALRYEEDQDDPSDIYAFELKDFYDMMSLFMSQMYFDEDSDDGEEEAYGPVHHLAHLLFHIVEAGEDVNP
ncbi:cytosolic protein [Caldibacillus lycopersici]|uniref:Cytosolic protein n=1 Tax=Perspicuibacillus lycopersici TaxID=1325689 RepID=A0AAE3LT68_9BACI|nr:cytosolic protein [Perspicuibacillus lycopersici]MCU9613558.1 cytosolic protein [Perspicuibacillus lycopersici]